MVSEEQHEIKVLLEIHIEDTTTQMHEPVKNYCFRVLPDNRRTTLPTLQTLADKAFSHMSDLGSRVGKHVRYQLLSAEYQDSSFSKKCVAFEQDPVFANLGDSGRLANYELKGKRMLFYGGLKLGGKNKKTIRVQKLDGFPKFSRKFSSRLRVFVQFCIFQ